MDDQTRPNAMQIHLFGYPTLRRNQQEIPLESAKVRALLAYLLQHPNTPQSRDYLAYLLWPDVPNETARKNLRQALYSLRKALGPLAEACLDIQRDAVRLRPHPDLWVDVWTFERLEKDIAEHPHRPYGACPYCFTRYRAMFDLYRGEFLHGFSAKDADPFEDWLIEQREHYRQRALAVVHQLTRFRYLRGHYAEAERLARRWLRLDPWSEAAYAYLIRALALQGRKGAALQAYRDYVRMMKEELALEPATEAQRLIHDVRQGLLPEPDSVRLSRLLPQPWERLIGRENERERLLYHLAQPETRLLSIVGLGGVGKSRLAEEVAHEAITLFPDGVYWVPLGGRPNALTRLQEHLQPLLEARAGPEGLLQALEKRRALLVLDDFPAHAPDLLAWVQRLLRRAREMVLLVTTRHPLNLRTERRLLLQGLAYPRASDEPLNAEEALTFPAVRLFVERMHRLNPDFTLDAATLPAVLDMVRFTQGLPLALELAASRAAAVSCTQAARELHQAALELEAPYLDQPIQHRSLRVLLEHTWNALSPDEQYALVQLAHFSAAFDAELAQELAQVSPDILGTLTQHGLLQGLRERAGLPSRWEMHPLIREFAREKGHTADQAATWQARAWAWLRKILPTVQVNTVVRLHQLHALQDEVRAFRAHLRQHGEAADFVNALPGLVAWFRHYGLFPDLVAFLQSLEQRLQQLPPSPQTEHARALWHRYMGLALYLTGQLDAAQPHFHRALEVLAQRPDLESVRVTVLQSLAGVVQSQGDLEAAQRYEEEALALCRALLPHPDPETDATLRVDLANSLNNLGSILFQQGAVEQALQYYEEAIALYRRHNTRSFLVATLTNYANALWALSRWSEAQEAAEEALRLAQAIGAQRPLANVLGALGAMALMREDLHTAFVRLRQALHAAEQANMVELGVVFKTNLAITLAMLHRDREAERHFREALQWARAHTVRYHEVETGVLFAEFLMDRGRLSEAQETLARALSQALQYGFTSLADKALTFAVKLWALQGEKTASLGLLHWLQQHGKPENQALLARWERAWFRKPTRSLKQAADRLTATLTQEQWRQAVLAGRAPAT